MIDVYLFLWNLLEETRRRILRDWTRSHENIFEQRGQSKESTAFG